MNTAPPSENPSSAYQPGIALACLLAFSAGYVDVVGFISLFGLFTAHVTGNFVMIGVDMAGDSTSLVGKILALPAFVLAVGATRLAETRISRAGYSPLAPLLLAESALLALFLAAALHYAPISDPAAPEALLAGVLAVCAMGIQNAMSKTFLSELGPTTIMTGNTTQIIIDLVDLRFSTEAQRESIQRRLKKMVPALIAFALGAIMGAVGYSVFAAWCVLVPIVLLIAASVRAWISLRRVNYKDEVS